LRVWQQAKELAVLVYQVTESWPTSEQFGLTSQVRRASVSVASNIAEGSARGSKPELARSARVALGSLAELHTQLEIARAVLPGLEDGYMQNLFSRIDTLRPQLISLLMSMRAEGAVREEAAEYMAE
jgi:four helix bundle protein